MILVEFAEAVELLREYRLPWAKTEVFVSYQKASRFAKKAGFPVVLKVYDPLLIHRTEKKGVITQINTEEDLKKAWEQLSSFLRKSSEAKIMVQKKEEGLELIMGMKRDPQFGPVIMFGLGGILVEIFHDISFRLAPLSQQEAREMIKEIKAYPLLKGFRHFKKVDIEKLARLLVKLARLSLDHSEIEEVDFNPVMANGRRLKIVDAKFFKNEKSSSYF